MSRILGRTLLALAGVVLCFGLLTASASAVPAANPVPVDGLDHAFTGVEYVSIPVKTDKVYSIDVSVQGYSAWAYVMDSDGNRLSEDLMFYGSVAWLQSHRFWHTPPAGTTLYLRMNGITSSQGYVVRVTEHDLPEITGTVRDFRTGAPVAGAQVRAWLDPIFNGITLDELPSESAAATGATTAADGTYRLSLPRPGTIYVRFDDPAGGRLGEWYDSVTTSVRFNDGQPTLSALKAVTLDAAFKASGVDGKVAEPGTIRLRFLRSDTGAPVKAAYSFLTAYDSNGAVSSWIHLAETDAAGETLFTGDPRLRYTVEGWFVPNHVALEYIPEFAVLPAQTTALDVTLDPEWIETTSDAKPTYSDAAEIKLTRRGNIPVAWTRFRLDAAQQWEVGDYQDNLITVASPGPHHLEFFSLGYSDSYTEQVRAADFTVTCGTHWSQTPTLTVSAAYARPVVLLAALKTTSPSGKSPSGAIVNIQASPNGVDSWRGVGTTKTTGEGAVSWSTSCYSATYYRFEYRGKADYYESATSSVMKVLPKTSVSNAIAPTRMSKAAYYSVYGFLKPRHTTGTYPIRIYKYRYVSGIWKPYGYITAKASDYSTYTKYSRSMSLPWAGRWRVRAYAPADAAHAATWSDGYDYITVR